MVAAERDTAMTLLRVVAAVPQPFQDVQDIAFCGTDCGTETKSSSGCVVFVVRSLQSRVRLAPGGRCLSDHPCLFSVFSSIFVVSILVISAAAQESSLPEVPFPRLDEGLITLQGASTGTARIRTQVQGLSPVSLHGRVGADRHYLP